MPELLVHNLLRFGLTCQCTYMQILADIRSKLTATSSCNAALRKQIKTADNKLQALLSNVEATQNECRLLAAECERVKDAKEQL